MDIDNKSLKRDYTELHEVKYVPAEIGRLTPQSSSSTRESFYLYFSILTALSMVMVGSGALSWPSSVIPKFTSNNTDINPLGQPATTLQISLIVGIPVFIGTFGSLIGPPTSDLLGRKKSMYFFTFGMLLSNIVLAYSTIINLIIISRSVFFICYVANITILKIFITEVCENHNRAKFGTLMGVFFPVGNLYSYFFGPMFSPKVFALILGAPLFIFIFFFWLTAESPVYLISKGRKEECFRSLKKLRHNKTNIELQEEYNELEASFLTRLNKKSVNIITLFKLRQGRRGVTLALIPILIQHMSGVLVLLTFLEPVFRAAGNGISPSTATVIIGGVKLGCFSLNVFVVEKIPRKILLIISSVGCSVSLFVLGLYFYLKEMNFTVIDSLQLLPLITVIAVNVCYSIALGPLPAPIMGELFSSECRSAGVSFIMTLTGVFIFIGNFFFPILNEYLGIKFSIWLFSFNSLFGAVLIHLFLPETKGLSIIQIQEKIENYKIGQ